MNKVYAVVGGGTSGITAIGQLIERLIEEKSSLTETIKIVVYEKEQPNIATGMPYNLQNSSVFLLNGPPAKGFKLLPGGKTLQEWMQENYETWKDKFPSVTPNDQFPPRALVGYYFKDQYTDIKIRAEKNGILIEEKIEEVIDVRPTTEFNYEIVTKNGNRLNAEKIILCFGHLPSDNFQNLRGKQNYIPSAWDSEALKQIPKDETVYVMGGHLSFIDAAKELVLTHNFEGKLITVSRHPSIVTLRDNDDKCDRTQVKDLEDKFKNRNSNSMSWQECRSLFWDSYEKSTEYPVKQSFLQSSYGTKQALSYQLAKLDHVNKSELNGNFDQLRDFMSEFCTGSCYTAMWNVLNETGKQEFAKHFYSLMIAFVAGIPPANARFLIGMYDKNRIEEHAGLTAIDYDEQKREFILKFEDGTTMQAKYLINATGAGRDITKHLDQYPLLANLIKNEVIRPSKWSGFVVNDTTNILAVNPSSNYFDGKPGLSAVFLGCHTVQEWINKTIPSININTLKTSCF